MTTDALFAAEAVRHRADDGTSANAVTSGPGRTDPQRHTDGRHGRGTGPLVPLNQAGRDAVTPSLAAPSSP